MALFTFVPPQGPSAGVTYYLPNTLGAFKTSLQINAASSGHVPLVGQNASMLGSGNGPIYPSGGLITCTFNITPAWLKTNGNTTYTQDINGVENALLDFWKAVVMGGLGVLTDRWWTGSVWATKTCTAILDAAPNPTRLASGLKCTIDCQLFCPTANWTDSTGSVLTMFR